jgi:hypothetical protein
MNYEIVQSTLSLKEQPLTPEVISTLALRHVWKPERREERRLSGVACSAWSGGSTAAEMRNDQTVA